MHGDGRGGSVWTVCVCIPRIAIGRRDFYRMRHTEYKSNNTVNQICKNKGHQLQDAERQTLQP